MKKLETIKPEEISKMAFPRKDILLTEDDRMRRQLKIEKAKEYGTSFLQSETRFIILTKSGYKRVTERVVNFSKKHVILKGQRQLPMNCILNVNVITNG